MSFYQDSEIKKLPTMHFEAMLNDIIMEVLKSKDIFAGWFRGEKVYIYLC